MAVNRLKITPEQYYQMTPVEFQRALDDYAEQKKEQEQTQFEAARYLAVNVWNAQGRFLRAQVNNPVEFLPFPWEKERQKAQSWQEMLNLMQSIAVRQNAKLKKSEKNG